MERDNLIQIVTLIIAIVALILAVFAVAVPDGEEEEDDEVNNPPTAVISVSETTVQVGEYISFDGFGSTDPEDRITLYLWEFGDGILDEGVYSKHFYSDPGTYKVTLTVVDKEGEMDTVSTNITVLPNSPPEAMIIMDEISFNVGENAYFNGSGSSDSDGRIVEWTWDFGDGKKDSGMHSNHIFQDEGVFSVTLTVIDDDGAGDSDSVDVTILDTGGPPDNDPPIASFEIDSTSIVVDELVIFNASESSDTDGSIVESSWDFGDGKGGSGKIVEHRFSYAGEYNVTLTVYDNDGAYDKVHMIVTVEPEPPTGALAFTKNTPGNYTGGIISLSDELLITDAFLYIWDYSLDNGATQDPIVSGVPFQVGSGLKLTYTDTNSNGKMDGGDVWNIENGYNGDSISLKYKTGETVAQYTIIETTPTGALSFYENTPGNYTGGLISLSSQVYVIEASLYIEDFSSGLNATQEPIQSGVPLQAGSGMILTYTDSNGNEKLDAGDVWTISNGGNEDRIYLIYISTGGTISTFEL